MGCSFKVPFEIQDMTLTNEDFKELVKHKTLVKDKGGEKWQLRMDEQFVVSGSLLDESEKLFQTPE
jgi:hypothetical protein